MKTLYLDIFSGISGDMFIGAMIDLGVDAGALERELAKLKLDGWHSHAARGQKCGITGVKFDVCLESGHSHEHTHADGVTHAHPHDHGDEAHQHSHGPHGGRLVKTSQGHVELSVFETNVPPRFRLYFSDPKGKRVDPPAAAKVAIQTIRPGRKRQTFKFRKDVDFLEATDELPEPHEFKAVLTIGRGKRDEKHEIEFVEDHPHPHPSDPAAGADHDHGHEHDHDHRHGRSFDEIEAMIRRSALSDWVKQKSVAVFRRVAAAEGKIHGQPPEKVRFHEVGAVDSIIDIVGACVALEMLNRPRVLSGPVVEGTGFVRCAHGRFPLPAPATLEILGARGAGLTQCEEPGELVTPTGAALLAEFAESFAPMTGLAATRVGYGLGTRDNRTRPNVLRAVLGDQSAAAAENPARTLDWETDTITVIETNLDDLNPEVLGHFVEKALAEGALDVFHTPVQMKKNRPGILLTVLCAAGDADRFSELMLRETSAFGVRRYSGERRKLRREFATAKTPYGDVRVKVGRLEGKPIQVSPEYESCRTLAERAGVPLKEVYEAAISSARNPDEPDAHIPS
jgi:uncharacterized protein (TIGR00299 family) protein